MTALGYQNWENKMRHINSQRLVQLANLFEVSVDYLIGRSNKRSSYKINKIMEELSENQCEAVLRFAQEQQE